MTSAIVLHVGIGKSGSSAIQGSLLQDHEALLRRGTLYPRAGLGRPGHSVLGDDVLQAGPDPRRARAYRELLDEVRDSGASTLVVSHEGFSVKSGAFAKWARSLCDELKPREVLVLGYVRPQWDLLESEYSQAVKNGNTCIPFEEYLGPRLARPRGGMLFPARFSPWRGVFGERLWLRPYSRDVLLGGDVVTDFWHVAGLGSPPPTRTHANVRPGARTTEMLRELGELLATKPAGDLPVRRILRRARRRIENALPDDRPFRPLTEEQIARIVERYAESNAELVRDYFGGEHAEVFSQPAESGDRPSTWSSAKASRKERRVFARVVEQALRDLDRPWPRARRGSAHDPTASG